MKTREIKRQTIATIGVSVEFKTTEILAVALEKAKWQAFVPEGQPSPNTVTVPTEMVIRVISLLDGITKGMEPNDNLFNGLYDESDCD